jgi:KDO2-lipid IV(A) lauroyltransferase
MLIPHMMERASKQRSLRHPRHWPMRIGVALFRALSALPWGVQRALAGALGWLWFYAVPVRRRVALVNLRLCFPERSEAKIRQLARAHGHALALGVFETCLAWWAPARRLPRHEIMGLENLAAARARGQGVLLLTAHFTTLELCARLLNEAGKFGCLYRDPNNPVVADVMRRQRERLTSVAIHFDDLRGLIRALRDGHVIWYAPDQARKLKLSALLPFFGVPAVTSTATSRIAAMTGAAVVPYFARRRADGSYLLTILPALDNFPSADSEADALRVNRLIEDAVRAAPEQYFWVHKRFKARGPELPDVYAR